jgi:hypothetical protein
MVDKNIFLLIVISIYNKGFNLFNLKFIILLIIIFIIAIFIFLAIILGIYISLYRSSKL